jgi:putative tryptophan/tyrosine transport system substrate-binding protein
MRRRDFIAGIGGAVAMPLRARAQQPAMPTIGYLAFSDRTGDVAAGFSKALNQAGYIEGRNVRIEVHSADRQPARLPVNSPQIALDDNFICSGRQRPFGELNNMPKRSACAVSLERGAR